MCNTTFPASPRLQFYQSTRAHTSSSAEAVALALASARGWSHEGFSKVDTAMKSIVIPKSCGYSQYSNVIGATLIFDGLYHPTHTNGMNGGWCKWHCKKKKTNRCKRLEKFIPPNLMVIDFSIYLGVTISFPSPVPGSLPRIWTSVHTACADGFEQGAGWDKHNGI